MQVGARSCSLRRHAVRPGDRCRLSQVLIPACASDNVLEVLAVTATLLDPKGPGLRT